MDKKERPMQRTIHGHEIPVPKRGDFLRNLEKLAKPKTRRKSRPRPRRPKQ